MVHEDNEFAHDSCESKLGRFASGTEVLVKLFEMAIGVCADQSGHVECASDLSAPAADSSFSMPLAAIPRVRSQARQGGSLAAVESSQFREFSQHCQGCDQPDTFDGLEFFHSIPQHGSFVTKLFKQVFYLSQIELQSAQKLSGLLFEADQGQTFNLLTLGYEQVQQLHPAANQFGQLLFLLSAWCGWSRLKFGTVIRQHRCIYVVGFGVLPRGACEVTNPGRVDALTGRLLW